MPSGKEGDYVICDDKLEFFDDYFLSHVAWMGEYCSNDNPPVKIVSTKPALSIYMFAAGDSGKVIVSWMKVVCGKWFERNIENVPKAPNFLYVNA